MIIHHKKSFLEIQNISDSSFWKRVINSRLHQPTTFQTENYCFVRYYFWVSVWVELIVICIWQKL